MQAFVSESSFQLVETLAEKIAALILDEFDVASQNYTSNHVWIKDGRHMHQSIPFRYAWPSELDLMAKLAGMELEHRWSDWDRSPFDRTSTKHISVWKKS